MSLAPVILNQLNRLKVSFVAFKSNIVNTLESVKGDLSSHVSQETGNAESQIKAHASAEARKVESTLSSTTANAIDKSRASLSSHLSSEARKVESTVSAETSKAVSAAKSALTSHVSSEARKMESSVSSSTTKTVSATKSAITSHTSSEARKTESVVKSHVSKSVSASQSAINAHTSSQTSKVISAINESAGAGDRYGHSYPVVINEIFSIYNGEPKSLKPPAGCFIRIISGGADSVKFTQGAPGALNKYVNLKYFIDKYGYLDFPINQAITVVPKERSCQFYYSIYKME